jgi:DNA-binding XRE family transcriptional regulator
MDGTSAGSILRLYPTAGYPTAGRIVERMGSPFALHTRRYKAFLARLRQARADAGLTQEDVAKKLGRTQTWVSNSELGERRVDFVELEDFAVLYGKSLDWFGTRRA